MTIWSRISNKLGEFVDDLSVDERTRTLLEAGEHAFETGDYGGAERAFEAVTRRADELVRAWLMLGSAQLRQNKALDARSAFERALVLRPDDPELLSLLARSQRGLGELDLALATARKAIVATTNSELLSELAQLRGEIFLQRRDPDRAVRELRKAHAFAKQADPPLQGLLGLAYALDRSPARALGHLRSAAEDAAVAPRVLRALCETALELGALDEAEGAAQRLLAAQGVGALGNTMLARVYLARQDWERAHAQLLFALERDASSVVAHRLLAELQRRMDNPAAALAHLRAAARQAADDRGLGRELAEVLIESYREPDPSAAGTDETRAALRAIAERLWAVEPEDPLAHAAAALAEPDLNAAMQRAARSLAAGPSYWGQLVLARLFERAGQLSGAIGAYGAALVERPESELARERLRQCYLQRHSLPVVEEGDRSAFVALLRRCEQLFAERATLADLAGAVARVQRDFDRPLLLAVMGEFNTGKSTFVNALIGEEVVPMGITPTTATINLLTYGEHRSARVLWQDDHEDLLEWEAVGPFLRGLDNAQARKVRVVELLYPAEELLRVNIVDTPGLNSIVEEHEATAREFLDRADAILWLFSADQAGKQTEERALMVIREQRLKTVGVVNKIDRLDPGQLEQVLAHLRTGFGELVETIQPVAAKQALEGQTSGDPARLEASRFGELRQLLDAQVFSRSRRIKRDVALRKLSDLCGTAHAQLDREGRSLRDAQTALAEVQQTLGQAGAGWIEEEFAQLHLELGRLFRQAATEVLDFVRPRRWVFGQHRVERADQDFVGELLSEGLEQLQQRSQERMLQGLRHQELLIERTDRQARAGGSRADSPALAGGAGLVSQGELLVKQVYGQFRAFSRGLLAGGRIERFFLHELPGIELTESAIESALAADLPLLEAELRAAIESWKTSLELARTRLLNVRALGIELELLKLEYGHLQPLRALEPLL